MLGAALRAGFQSVGVDTVDAGILPAGAVSYLTRTTDASYGAVISASHNPAEDNGIKFFGADGAKLSDELEDQIEARLRQGPPWQGPTGGMIGMERVMSEGLARYLDHLTSMMPYSLRGLDVVVDCANGAAFVAAPELFTRLKANVEAVAATPDGTNINLDCGATHPHFLARQTQGRLGLAFDGDADRLVAVDEEGVPANGDVIMAILARHLKEKGELEGNAVVITPMSNLGFRRAMADLEVEVVEAPVGDRYVLDVMRERRLALGGEQSGHVIFADRTTGDGLVTALRLVEVLASTGKPLSELRSIMTEYPQVLRNVPVASKHGLEEADSLWEAVRTTQEDLGEHGRVLVRASGTEPLVRVMVEADTSPRAAAIADDLAAIVLAELGPAAGGGEAL